MCLGEIRTVADYVLKWMPLQRMDGVYSAVTNESPTIIDLYQTDIKWTVIDGFATGEFDLENVNSIPPAVVIIDGDF